MRSDRVITVVGCHAEGEVGDVITGGVMAPPGVTMLDKKIAFERDLDHVRRLLICEPRGSVARHVNLLVPSTRADCACGAIIMEPTEYPPMSGSNTMCARPCCWRRASCRCRSRRRDCGSICPAARWTWLPNAGAASA